MLNNFRKTLRKKFSSHHSGYFFIIKILVVAYLSAREPQVSRYYSEVGSVSAQLFKRTTRATASLRFIINCREATKNYPGINLYQSQPSVPIVAVWWAKIEHLAASTTGDNFCQKILIYSRLVAITSTQQVRALTGAFDSRFERMWVLNCESRIAGCQSSGLTRSTAKTPKYAK